jgi:hypothetical protein
VRLTLELRQQVDHDTHWWSGGSGNGDAYFVDSPKGNAQCKFDHAGRLSLARNLAKDTDRIINDFIAGTNQHPYLYPREEIQKCPSMEMWRREQADGVSEKPPLPKRRRPGYSLSKKQDYNKRAQKMSRTKLSKRAPELSPDDAAEKNRKARNIREWRARKKVPLVEKEPQKR